MSLPRVERDCSGTGSGLLGWLDIGAAPPPKNGGAVDLRGIGEMGRAAVVKAAKGETARGEWSASDMDELNDWSTSMGRSFSVLVGEGLGEGKRVEGNDPHIGEEDRTSISTRRLVETSCCVRGKGFEGEKGEEC